MHHRRLWILSKSNFTTQWSALLQFAEAYAPDYRGLNHVPFMHRGRKKRITVGKLNHGPIDEICSQDASVSITKPDHPPIVRKFDIKVGVGEAIGLTISRAKRGDQKSAFMPVIGLFLMPLTPWCSA
jgi:hypothetical protein